MENPVRHVYKDSLTETWLDDNKLPHREYGPARIVYDNENNKTEEYYNHGYLHRINGPAIIEYEDNVVACEYYYLNGKQHREDGPASIVYKDGKIIYKNYYFNDKEFDSFKEMRYYFKTLILN